MEAMKLFPLCLFLCPIYFLLHRQQSFSLQDFFQKNFTFSYQYVLTQFDLTFVYGFGVHYFELFYTYIKNQWTFNTYKKRGGEAGKQLSGWDHMLLSQQTWILFLVHTWWFIASCDSSSRKSNALLQPHYQPCSAYRYMQAKYSNT